MIALSSPRSGGRRSALSRQGFLVAAIPGGRRRGERKDRRPHRPDLHAPPEQVQGLHPVLDRVGNNAGVLHLVERRDLQANWSRPAIAATRRCLGADDRQRRLRRSRRRTWSRSTASPTACCCTVALGGVLQHEAVREGRHRAAPKTWDELMDDGRQAEGGRHHPVQRPTSGRLEPLHLVRGADARHQPGGLCRACPTAPCPMTVPRCRTPSRSGATCTPRATSPTRAPAGRPGVRPRQGAPCT